MDNQLTRTTPSHTTFLQGQWGGEGGDFAASGPSNPVKRSREIFELLALKALELLASELPYESRLYFAGSIELREYPLLG